MNIPQQINPNELLENNKTEELLTVSEVAKYLRVDVTTIRRWVKQGLLEAITLPHRGVRRAFTIRSDTLDHLVQPEAFEGRTPTP